MDRVVDENNYLKTDYGVKDHKFIILGSYSANVLGQIRGLGERGIKPIGVLVHKNTFRIDKSKYLAKVHSVNTITEGLDLVLRVYGHENHKPFLYTDMDSAMALFDERFDELNDKFYVWNAGGNGKLRMLLNKYEQFKLAQECGIKIPKTEYVRVGELPKTLNYPIFTKAVDSLNPYWKGNAYICHTEEELKQAYEKMDMEYILLQEYIVKKDELPIEGISLRGGDEIVLLGRTVYYRLQEDSFGTYRYVEPFSNPELELKIKQLIKRFQYTGAFEIEFLINQDGTECYLETNFRIAQQNYAYVMLGANIPYLYAIFTLSGHIVEEEIQYVEKRKINIMHEFEDFKICVLNKKTSLLRWIKDVHSADCFSFYNKWDKLPFFYTLLEKIKTHIL